MHPDGHAHWLGVFCFRLVAPGSWALGGEERDAAVVVDLDWGREKIRASVVA